MKYISTKNIVISSVFGSSVEFLKGVPTYAPPAMHDEIIAAGVRAESELPEAAPVEGVVEPRTKDERLAAIYGAFKKITLRNTRDDFTANGTPHATAVARELGWSLSNKERDAAWPTWQQEGAAA